MQPLYNGCQIRAGTVIQQTPSTVYRIQYTVATIDCLQRQLQTATVKIQFHFDLSSSRLNEGCRDYQYAFYIFVCRLISTCVTCRSSLATSVTQIRYYVSVPRANRSELSPFRQLLQLLYAVSCIQCWVSVVEQCRRGFDIRCTVATLRSNPLRQ